MSRNAVQIVFRHIRGFCYHKAAAFFFVFDETRENLNYFRAFGHKNGQPLTYHFFGHENAEFSAEFVVIFEFRFFEPFKVIFEFGFFLERRAVNAGEHFVLFVSAPVRARYRSEFERLYSARGRKMRSAAQIYKVALFVAGNNAARGQVVYEFYLIRFAEVFEHLHGVFFAVNYAFYRQIAFYYLFHLVFEFNEIVARDGRFKFHVVIKTRFHGRTYREFGSGKNVFYRLRENVRRGMAVHFKPFGIFKRDYGKIAVFVNHGGQVFEFAVDFNAHGVSGKSFGNAFRRVICGYGRVERQRAAVF